MKWKVIEVNQTHHRCQFPSDGAVHAPKTTTLLDSIHFVQQFFLCKKNIVTGYGQKRHSYPTFVEK